MRLLAFFGCATVLAAAVATPDLPLSFERKPGGKSLSFLGRAGTHTVSLSQRGMRLQASDGSLELRFVGANPAPVMDPADPLPGKMNYLKGRDPARWVTGVATYARVRYKELYPGIDLICHGSAGHFEYDFEVKPGADPARIRFSAGKALTPHLDRDGDLVITAGRSEWRHHAPRIFQDGHEIAGGYLLQPHGEISFRIGRYDRRRSLRIDPVVVQSTLLSGDRQDNLTALAVDSAGNIYVAGWTNSSTFPVTTGAYDGQEIGGPCPANEAPYGIADTWCSDIFVTKLNPAGTTMLYSTYVGGTGDDRANAIAVDGAGNAYVTGWTDSIDFPTTAGALAKSQSGGSIGQDAFLFQLDPSGTRLLYSTYLGGTQDDQGTAIAASTAGDLFVTGTTFSSDFPIASALQPRQGGGDCSSLFFIDGGEPTCSDAYLMHWRIPAMTLVYSTYLGGSSNDAAHGIALDPAGNVYLAGETYSTDFPLFHAIQPALGGASCLALNDNNTPACSDAFVAKINAAGTALLYATYLGGSSSDSADAIAVDPQGNAYIAGTTYSADFPIVSASLPRPASSTCRGIWVQSVPCGSVFAAQINSVGSLVYSTYVGPADNGSATSIAVDASGNAFVAGYTPAYVGFPITPGALAHCNGAGSAAFLTGFQPDGALAYSTFFPEGIAAIAFGPAGLYIGGTGTPLVRDWPAVVETGFGSTTSNGSLYVAVLNLAAPAEGPAIDPGCVVNAAGYQNSIPYDAGYVAPGEIVAIFGQGLGPAAGVSATVDAGGYLPADLAGVSVTFNGTPAPMLYAGANQINAIAPFELSGETQAQVQVRNQGAASAQVTVKVAQSEEGVFTYGGTGTGQAAALNQDGSLNSPSNPAPRGSTVSIWTTGFGTMSPAYPDGLIVEGSLSQLVQAPQVFVGGIPATIQYAGQAPGLVAGTVQINFVIAGDTPAGPAIPISFDNPDFVVGFKQGVTIAIE